MILKVKIINLESKTENKAKNCSYINSIKYNIILSHNSINSDIQ